jgi:hypothetical protein
MPKACARCAMALPMRPRPTMPMRAPETLRPKAMGPPGHWPARTNWSACGMAGPPTAPDPWPGPPHRRSAHRGCGSRECRARWRQAHPHRHSPRQTPPPLWRWAVAPAGCAARWPRPCRPHPRCGGPGRQRRPGRSHACGRARCTAIPGLFGRKGCSLATASTSGLDNSQLLLPRFWTALSKRLKKSHPDRMP